MSNHEEAGGDWTLGTRAVSAGRPPREPDAPLNTPIVAVSSTHAGGRLEYAREGSATVEALEELLGTLEGGHATVFSSGMGAANAVMDLLPLGSTVVVSSAAYTGVASRLREMAEAGRINVTLVDVADTDAVVAACTGATLLWLESPTNPLLDVADLAVCIDAAHAAGAQVLVDNTFATPMLQRPLELGADYVMHSVTKSLSGHSDLLLGAIITSNVEAAEAMAFRRVLLGASPSAFDAFLAIRGIRTLPIRVERASHNAQIIAERLRKESGVSRVRYPGFGSIIAIEFGGDADRADRVCKATKLWTHATSLGGVESLLERRRRWPAEATLVPEDLVRLSVGVEDVEDLWRDLAQAIASS